MYMSRLIFAAGLIVVAHAAFAQAPTGSTPASTAPKPSAAPAASANAKAASARFIEALQKQTAIKSYQWTETMVVRVDGKEKATVVNTCGYNEDGGVSRTPVKGERTQVAKGTPGTAPEIDSYVNSAVAVMRGYVRPRPEKLQACEDAGRVSVSTDGKGQKLEYRDYLKPGDILTLVLDPSTSQILSSSASTYVINSNDRAEIHTEMAQLPDGSSYPSHIKFDTPGRQMGIVATDSNYRKKSS